MSSHRLSRINFETLARFRYELRRFLRFSEEVTQRNGVTPLQYLLMLQIKGFPQREWATVAELAERLQAKHHGVVSLVSRCEAAGWVRRQASENDKRCVEVRLTASGEACLHRLARLHRDELRSVKAGFSVPGVTVPDASAPLFEAIVAQTPDAIIFADCDGLIRVWNRGAEAVFGFSATEVIGSSLDIIIPERFRRAHWEGFRQAIANGHTQQGDNVRTTRATHKLGQRLYVDLSFALVKDEQGKVIGSVAVGRECSERFLADKALRERVSELERNAS